MSTCNYLLQNLGYECKEIADGVSQLISPFTKGNDGELIGIYIQQLAQNKYRVSDGGDSLAHMLNHNVSLNKNRLDEIASRGYREGVELTEIGELCASASDSDLPDAVNRVLTMCLEAGHLELDWLGTMQVKNFTTQVGEFLDQTYDHVERKPRVQALSGHQIEIAFSVVGASGISYVQPVGPRTGKLSWSSVYKVAGMMNDLREIDYRRFVIIDDTVEEDDLELGAAITTLSEHAAVLPYSRRAKWYPQLAS